MPPNPLSGELESLTARYPTRRGALLPILHRLQEQRGHLTPDDLRLAGQITHLGPAEVLSVATFYTMFRLKPVGRFPLGVCRNISCWVRGSEQIVATIEKECGIHHGETSPDGKWSLEEVECLGSCGTAPCLEIEGRYFEELTPDKVRRLLERLRNATGDPKQAVLDARAAFATARDASASSG